MMIGLLEIHGGVIQRLSAFFRGRCRSCHVLDGVHKSPKRGESGHCINRSASQNQAARLARLSADWGLPLKLETSIAVLIHPAFTTKQAVAKDSYSFDLGGGVGQLATSSGPQPQGNASGTGAINQDTGVTSANATGFVAAVEVPRFELSSAVRQYSLRHLLRSREVTIGVLSANMVCFTRFRTFMSRLRFRSNRMST
jgi:hypothetical protein